MPILTGNPSHYSKDQLKNVLISHNVPLPQGDQRKAVYLQLYLKHILPKDKEAADFSSDDEDTSESDLQLVGDHEETKSDKMDLKSLSDSELKEQLRKHGVNPGPILPTTRGIYEKKLQQLLGEEQVKENGGGHEDQYSDSEDEDVQVKNLLNKSYELNEDSGDRTLVFDGYSQNNYDGKSPDDDFSDLMPQSFLGLSATRRKPIKGAAGRPIQFRYDDIATRARMQEQTKEPLTEGKPRLVSVRLQILIFIVVVFLALVYITMESSMENPFNSITEDLAEVQQP